MAILRNSNDQIPIRHDVSIFGGLTQRGLDDTQLAYLDVTVSGEKVISNLIYTDVNETYRVIYKGYSGDLLSGNNGIYPLNGRESNWIVGGDPFQSTTPILNTVANAYELNFGLSRFASVERQVKVEVNGITTWVTANKYDASSYGNTYLPVRSLGGWGLSEMRMDFWGNENITYLDTFNNASTTVRADYQAALFNWMFGGGLDTTQFLFADDNLSGTRLDDVMRGGCGNDNVFGGNGHDMLLGDFGADTLYGDAGNDVLVFSGSSSVWDPNVPIYAAGSTTNIVGRGAYKTWTMDAGFGGTGKDYFIISLPETTYADSSVYPELPDLFVGATNGASIKFYNPYMSQSMDATVLKSGTTANPNGVSNLTMRVKVMDFKVGEDKLDLSAFGIDSDFIAKKSLSNLTGAAFIAAANAALKTDGLLLATNKSAWTGNNTSLFVKETNGMDFNGNGTTNDTLLEVQLVRLAPTAIGVKMFGEYSGSVMV